MIRASYVAEGGTDKKVEDKLAKATKDSAKITTEVLQGIMSQVIKDKLFNHSAAGSSPQVKAISDDSAAAAT